MKEKFAKLIDLKSIVTLVLIAAAVYGFVVGLISAELFATWVTAIIVFYFTKKPTGTAA